MLDPRSPFMASLLKSQEARLVGRQHLEAFVAAGNARDALGTLRDTDIGAWLEAASWQDAGGRDRAIWDYLREEVAVFDARHHFPREARRFCHAYLLKYDVANLKAVLQSIALGTTPLLVPLGALHAFGRLEALAAARTADEVIELLTHGGLEVFRPVLREFDVEWRRKSRLAVDTGLEAAWYRLLHRRVWHMGAGHVLAAACGLMVDLANLSILCRSLLAGPAGSQVDVFIPAGHMLPAQALHDALSHGWHELPRRLEHEFHRQVAADVVSAWERSESLAVTELVIEKHRLAALQALLAPQLAPAAVMAWFLVLKEIELRNVRLMLAAVEDGVQLEETAWQLLM